MPHKIFMALQSGFHSSPSIFRTVNFFLMYRRHRIPETPWEIMVAQAAPATPMLSTRMVNKSRATFMAEEISRKYRGVVLSPMDRMIPESMLYR